MSTSKKATGANDAVSGIAPPAELPAFLSTAPTIASPLPPHNKPIKTSNLNPNVAPSPSLPATIMPVASVVESSSQAAVALQSKSEVSPLPVTSQPKPPGKGLTMDANNTTEEEFTDISKGVSNDWVGWLKGTVSNVSSKVAQKAKTSMDSMITTLDPQMKQFLHSGGDLDLVVASDKEVKISPVREAFQEVFGKATVVGIAPTVSPELSNQPVGKSIVLTFAEHRINSVRSEGNLPHPSLPVIAIEHFIEEGPEDCWSDVGVLVLDDPHHDILLTIHTQSTPVPVEWVREAERSTPSNYAQRSTGLSTTIGSVAADKLQTHHSNWHEAWCGVSKREMIYLAAKSLASIYKTKLPQNY